MALVSGLLQLAARVNWGAEAEGAARQVGRPLVEARDPGRDRAGAGTQQRRDQQGQAPPWREKPGRPARRKCHEVWIHRGAILFRKARRLPSKVGALADETWLHG